MRFDPYEQWLGIPPHEQPPDYYRLLGVALFEPDPQVIARAADQRAALIRTFENGQYARQAKKLLDEIATARYCLLTPVQRRAYDDYLRQKSAVSIPRAPSNVGGPVNTLVPETSGAPEPQSTGTSDAARETIQSESVSPQWRRRAQKALLTACGIAGLIVLAAAVIARDRLRGREQPPPHLFEMPRTMAELPGEQPPPPAVSETPAAEPPAVSAPALPDEHASLPDQPRPEQPSTDRPSTSNEPPPPAEPPAAPPAQPQPAKLPVPGIDEQLAALKLADETYQFDKHRSDEENRLLAEEMIRVAERAECPPVEKYVLMRKAAEKYAEAGEIGRMLDTVDSLAETFQFDRIGAKKLLLDRVAQNVATAEGLAALVAASRSFCAAALDEERISEAVQTAAAVNQAVVRLGARAFRKETGERAQQLAKLYEEYQLVMGAKRSLQQTEDDPRAHEIVGWWYAKLGRWSDALPHLSRVADSAVAEAATHELEQPPGDADGRQKLADRWYEIGQNLRDERRDAVLRRAGHWYAAAQSELGGLAAAKAQKRLSEIEQLGPTLRERIVQASTSVPADDTIRPGVWIDLMPRIDPVRDAVQGRWQRSGDTLTATAGPHSRLALPIRLRNCEYDLDMEFVRTEGTDAVGLALPVVDRITAGVLSVGGQWAGFELVQNRTAADNRNPTRKPAALMNNRRHTLGCTVRTRNNITTIVISLNNQPLIQGVGNHAQLSLPAEWTLRETDRPALLAHQSAVVFRRIRIRLVSGTPQWTAPAGAVPAGG